VTSQTAPARQGLGRYLPALIAVVLIALLAFGLTRPRQGNAGEGTPMAGKPAPDFALKTLEGGNLTLSQFKGRPVLINFWASWCIPCKDEAPILAQTAIDYADEGLVIIGIAYQDTEDAARAFRDQYRMGFPVALDSREKSTAVQYGMTGVPESYFVDREGNIVAKIAGAMRASQLKTNLEKIL
jgi:cytochrome c biogenesis protein CcmG/thiol:disulfide interchange protein DsbE